MRLSSVIKQTKWNQDRKIDGKAAKIGNRLGLILQASIRIIDDTKA